MNAGYHEDWAGQEAGPEKNRADEFSWDEIEAPVADLSEEERAKLREAFTRVMQWQLRGIEKPSPGGSREKARTIGIRAVALAWMLNPALLGGKRSAAAIARDLGVSRKTMTVVMASARRHLWGDEAKKP